MVAKRNQFGGVRIQENILFHKTFLQTQECSFPSRADEFNIAGFVLYLITPNPRAPLEDGQWDGGFFEVSLWKKNARLENTWLGVSGTTTLVLSTG